MLCANSLSRLLSTLRCRNVQHRITLEGVPTHAWPSSYLHSRQISQSNLAPKSPRRARASGRYGTFSPSSYAGPYTLLHLNLSIEVLPSSPIMNQFLTGLACSMIQRISGWDGPISVLRFDSVLLCRVLMRPHTSSSDVIALLLLLFRCPKMEVLSSLLNLRISWASASIAGSSHFRVTVWLPKLSS